MGFVYVDALDPEVPLVAFEYWAETREVKKPKEDRALKKNMVLFELKKETIEVDMAKSLFIPTFEDRQEEDHPPDLESWMQHWRLGPMTLLHCILTIPAFSSPSPQVRMHRGTEAATRFRLIDGRI